MCEPNVEGEYKGTLDDRENKKTLKEIKQNLEKDLRFPKYNNWYKKADRRIRKEVRLLSVPLNEREKKRIREQYNRCRNPGNEWEKTPYEPYLGCNIRCGDCWTCNKSYCFGKECDKCGLRIRNVITACLDKVNSMCFLMCHECGKKAGRYEK